MLFRSGRTVRRFHQLPLERDSVVLLPTQWIVVHPIDANSPLSGRSPEALLPDDPEIFVSLSAIDDAFSQTVHTRFSYADREIVYGARFTDVYGSTADGVLTVDVSRLSQIEPAPLPQSDHGPSS